VAKTPRTASERSTPGAQILKAAGGGRTHAARRVAGSASQVYRVAWSRPAVLYPWVSSWWL